MKKTRLITAVTFTTLALIIAGLFFAPPSLFGRSPVRQDPSPSQPDLTQNIPLIAGWNVISSYLYPNNAQLDDMLAGISSQLVLLKNDEGMVYWPAYGINTLNTWQVNDGYQVFMTGPATLSISGTQVPPSSTILGLPPGWNLIAYHSAGSEPIADALAGYGADLQLAKNGAGEIYWPEFNIDQINNLQPGQGYWIFLEVGTAIDNEAPQIKTGQIAFQKEIISSNIWATHAVVGGDLDRDGDIDIAATNYAAGRVNWFQNDGSGSFTQKGLDSNFEYAYPIGIGDVDLDGHLDVLAGNYIGNDYRWYRNLGGGSFKRFILDENSGGAHSIITHDLDQDGDNDFITASEESDVVAWFENTGNLTFQLREIDTAADRAKRAEVADFNNDGDLDIVAGNFDARQVVWYENDGSESFTKHLIADGERGVYYVFPADINGDQHIDVFGALNRGDKITWYRNNGSGASWTKFTIDDALEPRTVIGEDLDQDGDIDAISANTGDDTVAWYENDGSGNFTKHIVDQVNDTTLHAPYGVSTVDVDLDGDMDVLSAWRDSAEIAIHTHIKAHTANVNMGGTLPINATRLRTEDVDDGPAGLTYTLTSAPQRGQVRLSGVNVPAGGTFTQADINNGRVTYVHTANNTTNDAFEFTVADGGESGVRPAQGTFKIIVN